MEYDVTGEKLYTLQEAYDLLHFDILNNSENKIQKSGTYRTWFRRCKMPRKRIGRRVYVAESDIIAYLNRRYGEARVKMPVALSRTRAQKEHRKKMQAAVNAKRKKTRVWDGTRWKNIES